MTTLRRLPVLAALGAVGLGLTGCASSGAKQASIDVQPGVSTVAPSASTAAASATTAAPAVTVAGQPTTSTTVAAAPAGAPAPTTTTTLAARAPIATLAVPNPDADGAGGDGPTDVRIDVLELTRQTGDTVRLRIVITNGGNDKVKLWDHLGEGSGDSSVGGISLVDLAGNQRYLTVRDTPVKAGERGACACTVFASSIEEIEPGSARSIDATFPAPPAAVQVVDVQLPTFGALRDVRIATGNA